MSDGSVALAVPRDDLGEYFLTHEAQTLGIEQMYALATIRRVVGRPMTCAEYEQVRAVIGHRNRRTRRPR